MKRWMLTCLAMLSLLAVIAGAIASPVAAAPGGNATNAKQCQKGGWTSLARKESPTVAFVSEKACTSYAAQGGTLRPLAPPSLTLTIRPGLWTGSGSGLLAGSTITVDFVYLDGFVLNGDYAGTADDNGNFIEGYGYSCLSLTSVTLHGVAADGSPVSSATVPASC